MKPDKEYDYVYRCDNEIYHHPKFMEYLDKFHDPYNNQNALVITTEQNAKTFYNKFFRWIDES